MCTDPEEKRVRRENAPDPQSAASRRRVEAAATARP